jgi:hypothetical protein
MTEGGQKGGQREDGGRKKEGVGKKGGKEGANHLVFVQYSVSEGHPLQLSKVSNASKNRKKRVFHKK